MTQFDRIVWNISHSGLGTGENQRRELNMTAKNTIVQPRIPTRRVFYDNRRSRK